MSSSPSFFSKLRRSKHKKTTGTAETGDTTDHYDLLESSYIEGQRKAEQQFGKKVPAYGFADSAQSTPTKSSSTKSNVVTEAYNQGFYTGSNPGSATKSTSGHTSGHTSGGNVIVASSVGKILSTPPKVNRQPVDRGMPGDFSNEKKTIDDDLVTHDHIYQSEKTQFGDDAATKQGKGFYFDPNDTQGGYYGDPSNEHSEATQQKLDKNLNLKTVPSAYQAELEEKERKQAEKSKRSGKEEKLKELDQKYGDEPEENVKKNAGIASLDPKEEHNKNKSIFNPDGIVSSTGGASKSENLGHISPNLSDDENYGAQTDEHASTTALKSPASEYPPTESSSKSNAKKAGVFGGVSAAAAYTAQRFMGGKNPESTEVSDSYQEGVKSDSYQEGVKSGAYDSGKSSVTDPTFLDKDPNVSTQSLKSEPVDSDYFAGKTLDPKQKDDVDTNKAVDTSSKRDTAISSALEQDNTIDNATTSPNTGIFAGAAGAIGAAGAVAAGALGFGSKDKLSTEQQQILDDAYNAGKEKFHKELVDTKSSGKDSELPVYAASAAAYGDAYSKNAGNDKIDTKNAAGYGDAKSGGFGYDANNTSKSASSTSTKDTKGAKGIDPKTSGAAIFTSYDASKNKTDPKSSDAKSVDAGDAKAGGFGAAKTPSYSESVTSNYSDDTKKNDDSLATPKKEDKSASTKTTENLGTSNNPDSLVENVNNYPEVSEKPKHLGKKNVLDEDTTQKDETIPSVQEVPGLESQTEAGDLESKEPSEEKLDKTSSKSSGGGLFAGVGSALGAAAGVMGYQKATSGTSSGATNGTSHDKNMVEAVEGYEDVSKAPKHPKDDVAEESEAPVEDDSALKSSTASAERAKQKEDEIAKYNKEHNYTSGKPLIEVADVGSIPKSKDTPKTDSSPKSDSGSSPKTDSSSKPESKNSKSAGAAALASGSAALASGSKSESKESKSVGTAAPGSKSESKESKSVGTAASGSSPKTTDVDSVQKSSTTSKDVPTDKSLADTSPATDKSLADSSNVESSPNSNRNATMFGGGILGSAAAALGLKSKPFNNGSDSDQSSNFKFSDKEQAEYYNAGVEQAAYEAGREKGIASNSYDAGTTEATKDASYKSGQLEGQGSEKTIGKNTAAAAAGLGVGAGVGHKIKDKVTPDSQKADTKSDKSDAKSITSSEGDLVIEVIGVDDKKIAAKLAKKASKELAEQGVDLSSGKLTIDANTKEIKFDTDGSGYASSNKSSPPTSKTAATGAGATGATGAGVGAAGVAANTAYSGSGSQTDAKEDYAGNIHPPRSSLNPTSKPEKKLYGGNVTPPRDYDDAEHSIGSKGAAVAAAAAAGAGAGVGAGAVAGSGKEKSSKSKGTGGAEDIIVTVQGIQDDEKSGEVAQKAVYSLKGNPILATVKELKIDGRSGKIYDEKNNFVGSFDVSNSSKSTNSSKSSTAAGASAAGISAAGTSAAGTSSAAHNKKSTPIVDKSAFAADPTKQDLTGLSGNNNHTASSAAATGAAGAGIGGLGAAGLASSKHSSGSGAKANVTEPLGPEEIPPTVGAAGAAGVVEGSKLSKSQSSASAANPTPLNSYSTRNDTSKDVAGGVAGGALGGTLAGGLLGKKGSSPSDTGLYDSNSSSSGVADESTDNFDSTHYAYGTNAPKSNVRDSNAIPRSLSNVDIEIVGAPNEIVSNIRKQKLALIQKHPEFVPADTRKVVFDAKTGIAYDGTGQEISELSTLRSYSVDENVNNKNNLEIPGTFFY